MLLKSLFFITLNLIVIIIGICKFVSEGEIYDYIIHKKRLTEDDTRSKFRQARF